VSDRRRRILGSLPVLVTTHADDGEGTYTGVYTGLQVKSSESPKDLIGEPLVDVINAEATAVLLDAFETALETGDRQYVEFPVEFGDETFWRGAYVAPLPAGPGSEPEEVMVAGFDLTRHDERERALYDVFDALESHAARRDLERAFCERLVGRRRYAMAWIGATDRDGAPTVRASADADAYLTDLRDAAGDLDAAADPGVRVLQASEPTSMSVSPIESADSDDDRDWAAVATAHGLQAAMALPLVHERVDHGVLTVYLADSEYLVPWRAEVLTDYADAVGYALSAAMWQWALAADAAATLTVDVDDELPLSGLCDAAGLSELDVVSVVPRPAGTVYYLRGGDESALVAAAERYDGVEPYGVGSDGVPAVVAESVMPEHRLVKLGARVRSYHVTPRKARIRLAVPGSETARSVRTVIQEGYPSATIGVQWGSNEVGDAEAFVDDVGSALTDRQYEMLEAAYRHGYFERNRRCNLSELAEALDLSRWTVSEHLRLAQHKLCSHLLD